MENTVNVYKPVGITPLQAIKRFKERYPLYKDKKIAYAGRLDPLAQGVLILLIEPETRKRKYYQSLDKTYEFQILFGIVTDTHDALGKIVRVNNSYSARGLKPHLSRIAAKYKGKTIQEYPIYSSKTVEGKPLYWWARKKKLHQISIPTKTVEIKDIRVDKLFSIDSHSLQKNIFTQIKKVDGDFRQNEIVQCWSEFFQTNTRPSFQVAKMQIECSSGTYVRSLAHKIGVSAGTGAIALEILRKSVGEYGLSDSIKV